MCNLTHAEKLDLFRKADEFNRTQYIDCDLEVEQFEVPDPPLMMHYKRRSNGMMVLAYVGNVFRDEEAKVYFEDPYSYYPKEALDEFAERIRWQLPLMLGHRLRTRAIHQLLLRDLSAWTLSFPADAERGELSKVEVIEGLLKDPAWFDIEATTADALTTGDPEPLDFLTKYDAPSWPIYTRLGAVQLTLVRPEPLVPRGKR